METEQPEGAKRRGRPRKEGELTKNLPLHVYLDTTENLALIKQAAGIEGLPVATWARRVLLREARRVLGRKNQPGE
jgi:hypothetical protein